MQDWGNGLEKTNKMEKVELFFSPMLTGEYVSRDEKKAISKLREEFEKNG